MGYPFIDSHPIIGSIVGDMHRNPEICPWCCKYFHPHYGYRSLPGLVSGGVWSKEREERCPRCGKNWTICSKCLRFMGPEGTRCVTEKIGYQRYKITDLYVQCRACEHVHRFGDKPYMPTEEEKELEKHKVICPHCYRSFHV